MGGLGCGPRGVEADARRRLYLALLLVIEESVVVEKALVVDMVEEVKIGPNLLPGHAVSEMAGNVLHAASICCNSILILVRRSREGRLVAEPADADARHLALQMMTDNMADPRLDLAKVERTRTTRQETELTGKTFLRRVR